MIARPSSVATMTSEMNTNALLAIGAELYVLMLTPRRRLTAYVILVLIVLSLDSQRERGENYMAKGRRKRENKNHWYCKKKKKSISNADYNRKCSRQNHKKGCVNLSRIR